MKLLKGLSGLTILHVYVLYKLDGRFVMNVVVLLADADIPEQEHEWGIEKWGW